MKALERTDAEQVYGNDTKVYGFETGGNIMNCFINQTQFK